MLSKIRYSGILSLITKDCGHPAFQIQLTMSSWISNTRPYLCFILNRASKAANNTMCEEKITEFNKATEFGKDDKHLGF